MIYAILRESDGHIKIGYSDSPKRRVKEIGPAGHSILAVWPGSMGDERAAHVALARWNANEHHQGTDRAGPREWFVGSDEVMAFIASMDKVTVPDEVFTTVTFKIEKELAAKLERKAKEVPKRTVSGYLRGLVVKALGK